MYTSCSCSCSTLLGLVSARGVDGDGGTAAGDDVGGDDAAAVTGDAADGDDVGHIAVDVLRPSLPCRRLCRSSGTSAAVVVVVAAAPLVAASWLPVAPPAWGPAAQ